MITNSTTEKRVKRSKTAQGTIALQGKAKSKAKQWQRVDKRQLTEFN